MVAKFLLFAIFTFLSVIGITFSYFVTNRNGGGGRIRADAEGAVVTNGVGCATIGADILKKGGSAVDSAIAALFCEGVSLPQSMGLGGGFLMTIYIKEDRTVYSLNSRETAPAAAAKDMFDGNSTLSLWGGLAVAVPAELRGYWWAWQRFGQLDWAELVQPTIDLCRDGILVTDFLASVFEETEERLQNDPGLKSVFINNETNKPYKAGDKIKMLKLGDSLEIIAKEGGDAIHNGSLTKLLVQDVQAHNGVLTVEDLNNYEPEWQDPITTTLPDNLTLYTSPLPGSGVILTFLMNLLKENLNLNEPEGVTNYQRIIESFKFAYGRRTKLGDPNFNDGMNDFLAELTSEAYANAVRANISDNSTSQDPEFYGATTVNVEDHGTAHICVLAPNGDAVAVTSTVNMYFGAAFMSLNTGVILNDQMDDFSSPDIDNAYDIPPSPANFIVPGKRALSSMAPTIIINNGTDDVELIIGSAGGTKITTAISLALVRYLWYKMPIDVAINERRLHHQLFPMAVQLEEYFLNDTDFLSSLEKIGHKYELDSVDGFSSITAVTKTADEIIGTIDNRRWGEIVYV